MCEAFPFSRIKVKKGFLVRYCNFVFRASTSTNLLLECNSAFLRSAFYVYISRNIL